MSEASSSQGYAIVDWDVNFEVTDRGAPWRPAKDGNTPDPGFRAGALNYMRIPLTGTFARRLSMVDRIAGDDALWIKGLFLVELAGLIATFDRPNREGGILRGVDGGPATIEDLAEALAQPPERMARAIEVLSDRRVGILRVVTLADTPRDEQDSKESQGVPGDSTESHGIPGSLCNDSRTDSAQSKGRAEQQHEQGQGQEQAPGNPRGELGLAKSLCWEDCMAALRRTCGANATITAFSNWLGNNMVVMSDGQSNQWLRLVMDLVEKSATKDNPGGWFIGAVKRPQAEGGFGYVPSDGRNARQRLGAARS